MQKSELFDQLQALGSINTEQQQQQSSLPSAAAGSAQKNDGSSSSSSKDDIDARGEQLGMSMAVLTTLVRLLELKLIQMEGDEGTGECMIQMERDEGTGECIGVSIANIRLATLLSVYGRNSSTGTN